MSTEARLLIVIQINVTISGTRKGEERVKAISQAPTRKTKDAMDRCQNNKNVQEVSPHHCAAASILFYYTAAVSTTVQNSHKDNVRTVRNRVTTRLLLRNNWGKRSPTFKPCSISLLFICSGLTWGSFLLLISPGPAEVSNFFVRVQLTSLLLILPGLDSKPSFPPFVSNVLISLSSYFFFFFKSYFLSFFLLSTGSHLSSVYCFCCCFSFGHTHSHTRCQTMDSSSVNLTALTKSNLPTRWKSSTDSCNACFKIDISSGSEELSAHATRVWQTTHSEHTWYSDVTKTAQKSKTKLFS